jgi:Fe-S-cluster containining protein
MSSKRGKSKQKGQKKPLCSECTGLCCRYFALPIETPEDWDDFDDIRWYLAHEDITVFVEDGDWYLNIKNKCRHLNSENYRCDIYEKRPKICRKYEDDSCDFTGNDYEYELHFVNDKQMEEYMKIKFGPNVLDKLLPKKLRKDKKKQKVHK